jgi:hypothetical protein
MASIYPYTVWVSSGDGDGDKDDRNAVRRHGRPINGFELRLFLEAVGAATGGGDGMLCRRRSPRSPPPSRE